MTQVSCRLPRAVLVDVDGTLALRDEGTNVRAFYHWDRVGEDTPNTPVVELVQLLAASGRYPNAGQCSGLQAGGEGPRWEGR